MITQTILDTVRAGEKAAGAAIARAKIRLAASKAVSSARDAYLADEITWAEYEKVRHSFGLAMETYGRGW